MGGDGIDGRPVTARARRRWGRPAAVVLLGLTAWGHGGPAHADADDDDESESPLADLLGYGDTEPAEDRRRQLEVEELTAECMRAEGWEYEPVDWSAMQSSMGEASEMDMELQTTDPEAYGERYGYGVMRNYEIYEAAWLEDPEAAMEEQSDDFVDPNQDYVSSLSESEMNEYYVSLYGEMSMTEATVVDDIDEEGEPAMPTPEEMGCSGQAQAEVYTEFDMDPDVQQRIGEYYETISDDPRMADAQDAWMDCMGDVIEGYTGWDGEPVDNPEDMWNVFETKKYEAQGLEERAFEDESELGDEMYYSMSQNEDGSGVAWMGEPEPIPDDEVAALTEQELETWQRDQECQDESGVYDVSRELEQELVDQLLDEFPELAEVGSSGDD